jgi:hypothetical protein
MTKPAILSAAAIAVAMLAFPLWPARAMTLCGSLPTTRIYVNAVTGERTADARFCTPAPRVAAFATQPWD